MKEVVWLGLENGIWYGSFFLVSVVVLFGIGGGIFLYRCFLNSIYDKNWGLNSMCLLRLMKDLGKMNNLIFKIRRGKSYLLNFLNFVIYVFFLKLFYVFVIYLFF